MLRCKAAEVRRTRSGYTNHSFFSKKGKERKHQNLTSAEQPDPENREGFGGTGGIASRNNRL